MLRHALYMPTLVATRFNPDLNAKYQAMIAAGKPKKLAITALMRKLLLLANALVRNDRTWAASAA
jgi:transposase